MLSRYEKREKFKEVKQLLIEIFSDERLLEQVTQTSQTKQEATVIARCELGYGLEFIEKAERRIGIRDGEIQP